MQKIILLFCISIALLSNNYRYRKYLHVREFYKDLAQQSIVLALKYNIPPAAVLAIAGVESGYGRGYVAKISGNILSLGAFKNEKELPSLYLPYNKITKKVIYSQKEINSYPKSQLIYRQRPKSLKKDYRPQKIAGTTKELDYFDLYPNKKIEANLRCIEDFMSKWISAEYRYTPFRKAREDINNRVLRYGQNVIFTKEASVEFINNIGGKPNSFNYRQSWTKKVITVMQNIGLIELLKNIKDGKNFNQAWDN